MVPVRVLICSIIILLFVMYSVSSQELNGTVHIYIFLDTGLPLAGATVDIKGITYTSDTSGLLAFSHPPGKLELTLFYKGSQIAGLKVSIRQAQTTEVIITITGQGDTIMDDESEDNAAISEEEKSPLDLSRPLGTLVGTVTHIETNKPVENATIIFRGVDFEAKTDEKGIFKVELPEGTYSVSLIHTDFSTQTVESILVKAEKNVNIEVQLTPSAIQLEAEPVFASTEVRVQGGIADLIEETKNSAVVMNIIGFEQMSIMGDSDAASALRRVTGLSVIGGRFVYVRGMGERYACSYLNGGLLPSPEIDKRVVPLDLFPVSIIESMAIQKSYSPHLLGDFGGGAVMLRTLGIPKDRYKRRTRINLKTSVTYTDGSTFTEALMEEQGALDFLGIDDGHRELPGEIAEIDFVQEETYTQPGVSSDVLEDLGELMPNNWSTSLQTIPLSYGLSASVRDKIEISDMSNFGYNISLMYKNKYDSNSDMIETGYSIAGDDEYTIRYDYEIDSADHEVDICCLIDLVYEVNKKLSFSLTSLLVRLTDNETEQYDGYYGSDAVYVSVIDQLWVENMLINEKLSGVIGFDFWNQAELNWDYSYSLASRYEPDHRTTRYDCSEEDGTYHLTDRPEGSRRVYSSVVDHVHDGGLQLNIPVFLFSETEADFLEIGVQAMYRVRGTDTRKFLYVFSETNVPHEILELPPEDLFTDDYIGEYFTLREITTNTDNYDADLLVLSGFFVSDILLFDRLRSNAGVRFEYGQQNVHTFDLYTNEPDDVLYETYDFLPSVNFTYSFSDTFQFRLGGNMTLNRPDFHEKSNIVRDEHLGKGQYIGNPELEKADIYHADTRVEGYFSETENISFGLFYKYFVDPIEVVGMPKAGSTLLYTWMNTGTAFNLGAELDWKLSFSLVSDMVRKSIMSTHFKSLKDQIAFRKVFGGIAGFFRDLYTTGNVAFIWSEVDYSGMDSDIEFTNTSTQRALQGQSPYVINVSLGYENSISWSQKAPCKTSIYLNYNVFGRRLLSLGTYGVPDVFEEPFHQLDLVAKQQFNEVLSIGLKAKNILDLSARKTIGGSIWSNLIGETGTVIYEYNKGRSFELSVSMSL